MVNPFTCDQALDFYHMLSCSSPCAYFEKQLSVSITRIKPSYHDLELLYDNLFFDLLVANFSSSCASMWSKNHILLESFVESGYDERINWFSWSLSDVFHAKRKREFVDNCDYESSFLYASMKTLGNPFSNRSCHYFYCRRLDVARCFSLLLGAVRSPRGFSAGSNDTTAIVCVIPASVVLLIFW
ncbi:hypothetical protein M9H77_22346 [Catharanthus roseus]|uniref:Uncharacterized protein n=1 Tax=Catharanthus roseus TaxID=4058 RepID=A0ACC0AU91_CATRO|nr:hypothetical protein M9H77_22346 [Catharanthus roseus]